MGIAYNFLYTVTCMAVGSALTVVTIRLLVQGNRNTDPTHRKTDEDDEDDDDTTQLRVTSRGMSEEPIRALKKHEDLLTGIVAQLWSFVNPAVCESIRESVEPSFRELPGPLSSMKFTDLDLGEKPLILENMAVHDLKNGVVQFDMDVNWKAKCKINMKASYVGSLGVQTIEFSGRLAFIMKPLTKVLPCVSTVQMYFIDPPIVHLDFTGLAQVADLKVIKAQILATILDSLKSMMVAPTCYVAQKLVDTSYLDMYHAPQGIARVTLIRGEGFVDEQLAFNRVDIPDTYCLLRLGTAKGYRSRTIKDNRSPVWDTEDFVDFLLYDYGQSIFLEAWDEDSGAVDADDFLGQSQITVRNLLLSASNRTVTLPLVHVDGSTTGASVTLRCDLLPLSSDLKSLTNQKPSPATMGGLLTVILDKATDIPLKDELELTRVRVSYGADTYETASIAGSNPLYEIAFHIPIMTDTFRKNGGQDVVFDLLQGEKSLGSVTTLHATLMRASETTITETKSIGSQGAKLSYKVIFQGIDLMQQPRMVESFSKVSATPVEAPEKVPEQPITEDFGTIKLTAVRARGFEIQRRRLRKDDIPDVYLVVKVGSDPNNTWRTQTVKNNTAPVWNESSAFVLKQKNEKVLIDAYDENRRGKDDYLGHAGVTVNSLLLAGGTMEVELSMKTKPTGYIVTLKCEKVGS